jgi:hypothetical protein
MFSVIWARPAAMVKLAKQASIGISFDAALQIEKNLSIRCAHATIPLSHLCVLQLYSIILQ